MKKSVFLVAGRGKEEGGAKNTARGHHLACLNTCQNFLEFQEVLGMQFIAMAINVYLLVVLETVVKAIYAQFCNGSFQNRNC